MLRLFLFLLLTTVYGDSYAQNGSYTRCSDGIILSHNNDYHVVFPGKPGPDKSGLNGYGTDQLVTKNKIWLFFDPPSTGIINIKTTATSSSFSTYIFKEMSGDICSDFQKQKAQLLVFESEKKELEENMKGDANEEKEEKPGEERMEDEDNLRNGEVGGPKKIVAVGPYR